MSKRYFFRSSINIHWAALLSVIMYLPIGLLFVVFGKTYWIYAVTVIAYYLLLSNTINLLEIDDQKVTIHYFLRLFMRKKVKPFSSIKVVRDININDGYEYPRIQILSNQTSSRWFLPYNTFPIYNYKKRKEILMFFKSQNIIIEILSNKEKEIKILE